MDSVKAMEAQLLAEMTNAGPVNDYLEINAESRTISVPSTEILFGVKTDESVERKYFRCPKIVGDNIDLTTLGLRILYENANGDKDKYIVRDVQVVGDYITFSWQIEGKVVAYNGNVTFAMAAVKVDENGIVKNAWNTTTAVGNVLNGMEVDDLYESEETEVRDVLQQLLNILDTEVAEAVQNVENEGSTQISKIQSESTKQQGAVANEGLRVLNMIPADYTAMSEQVDSLTKLTGPVIKQEVEGGELVVRDSAKMPLFGLHIFGKGTQIKTNGYQLFNANKIEGKTASGVTLINNGDGSFTVSGSGTVVDEAFSRTYNDYNLKSLLKPGKLYLNNHGTSAPVFHLYGVNADGERVFTLNNGLSVELTQEMIDSISRVVMTFYGNIGTNIVAGTVKPMLYQEGDGTWEAFSGGQASPSIEYPQEIKTIKNPTFHVYSRNLLDVDDMLNSQLAKNDDGLYTLTKNGTGGSRFSGKMTCNIPAGTYTFSVGEVLGNDPRMRVALTYSNGKELSVAFDADVPRTVTTPVETTKIALYIPSDKEDGDYTTFRDLMMEVGEVATEYDEFKGIQTVESTVELPGIPVTSGGNYVDENGQQYIADYRDWSRGVDVKRVNTIALTSTFVINESTNETWIQIADDVAAVENTEDNLTLCTHFPGDSRKNVYDNAFKEGYRGVCVRDRFLRIVDNVNFNANPDALNAWIQSKKDEGVDVLVSYVLGKPIETPIPEAELQVYRELHTNYPNTTILNDSEAHMKLTYATDTKMYIDNKFAELRAAITNNS